MLFRSVLFFSKDAHAYKIRVRTYRKRRNSHYDGTHVVSLAVLRYSDGMPVLSGGTAELVISERLERCI